MTLGHRTVLLGGSTPQRAKRAAAFCGPPDRDIAESQPRGVPETPTETLGFQPEAVPDAQTRTQNPKEQGSGMFKDVTAQQNELNPFGPGEVF